MDNGMAASPAGDKRRRTQAAKVARSGTATRAPLRHPPCSAMGALGGGIWWGSVGFYWLRRHAAMDLSPWRGDITHWSGFANTLGQRTKGSTQSTQAPRQVPTPRHDQRWKMGKVA